MDEEKPYVLALVSSRADFLIFPKNADRRTVADKLGLEVLVEAPITKKEAVSFQKDGVRAVR